MTTRMLGHWLLALLVAVMAMSQSFAGNLARTPASIRQTFFDSDDHAEVGCNVEKSDCFLELKLGPDVRRYVFDLAGMGYTPIQIDGFDFWENSGWSNFNIAMEVPCTEDDAKFFGRPKFHLECRLWLTPEGTSLVAERIDVRVFGDVGRPKTRFVRPVTLQAPKQGTVPPDAPAFDSPSTELGPAEIRMRAASEIRQCCSGSTSEVDLTIKKTPDGWHVEAPSACVQAALAASVVANTNRSVDDVEQTTILCAGGGASLFYDNHGTLLKLIRWQ